jgi:uncharacterized repeat protein (TIGR03803 family)
MRTILKVCVAVVTTVLMMPPAQARAQSQSFEVVTRFAAGPISPSELLLGPDGRLYGTSRNGGDHGKGTVFRIEPDGSTTVLHSFRGDDGYQPVTGLTLASDGNIYGTTWSGGIPVEGGDFTGNGTIFRIDGNGNFTMLYAFGIEEPGPADTRLVAATDGWLYGVNALDAVFRFEPTTGSIEYIHTFNPPTEGRMPRGLIQASDGFLYGVLQQGGAANPAGAIFRMTPDEFGTVVIKRGFSSLDPVRSPTSLLQGSDGFFYGTSIGPVPNSTYKGTIFRMDFNGNVTVLHQFAQEDQFGCSNDFCPSLAQASDGSLWGTTVTPGCGYVFRYDTVNSLYSSVVSLDCSLGNNTSPLTAGADGFFYGTSGFGSGAVFRLTTSGPVDIVEDFATNSGSTPTSPLVRSVDGDLYGTAQNGGPHGRGTVFKIDASGEMTVIHAFTASQHGYPRGGMVEVQNGIFFGTTSGAVDEGKGTVFRVTSAGVFQTLHTFDGSDGAHPHSDLLLASDGSVYGTTSSEGAMGLGTVFRIAPNGAFETVHAFEGGEFDGASPGGGLIEGIDGAFYGTTSLGGVFDMGTVFRMEASGAVTLLHDFGTGDSGLDGANPAAGLVRAPNGLLYGTTQREGIEGSGTLFRIATTGEFTPLLSFNGETGAEVLAPLTVGPDGLLYGTTSNFGTVLEDGTWAGMGTVFRLGREGEISVLHRFTDFNASGGNPSARLVDGGGGLYFGTAPNGAAGGVVYRVSIASETPSGNNIEVQPVDPNTGTAPVNLTFGEVVTPGETSVEISNAPSVPPPANFNLGTTPTYFDVTTTATFAGEIQVCFDYSNVNVPNPATAQLLHFDGADWVNVTASNDVTAHIICGVVESLSPFVIGNAIGGGPELVSVGSTHAWLGLKTSDDQGTRFDLLAEVYHGSSLVTSGLTRCIIGVSRNPNQALEALVQLGEFGAVPLESGDEVTIRLSTRIGTNPNGTKCGGHNNAAGLRLYYDGATRPSRVEAQLSPADMTDYFLHTAGPANLLDDQAPDGAAKFKDSPAVSFVGGNPWKAIGGWTLTVP